MTMQDRYIIVVKTMLGQGMPMTLKLIGACLLFSLLIGIVFGTIRSLKIPVIDQILGLYAVVCRGIPTIIVLLFFYATLVRGTQFWISVLSISLVEGAYMMEIVKGGFLSVDKGQWEAAKALNLPLIHTIVYIVLPQVMLVTICGGHHRLYGCFAPCAAAASQVLLSAGDLCVHSGDLLHHVPLPDMAGQAAGAYRCKKDYG